MSGWFALLGLAACGQVDVPDGPDMTSLVQDFQRASAPIDSDEIDEVLTDATETAGFVQATQNLGYVRNVLESGVLGRSVPRGMEAESSAGAGLLAKFLEGEAVGKITTVCRGWDGATEPDEATNGRASLNFTATQDGLRRVVWGRFDACRFAAGGMVEFDGDFSMYLNTADRFYIGDDFVIRLDGRISLKDGRSTEGQIEFRIVEAQGLTLRIQRSDGHLLFVVSEGVEQQELEAVNDLWTCNFEAKQCTSSNTGQSVTW